MTNKIILPLEGFIEGPEEIKPVIRFVKGSHEDEAKPVSRYPRAEPVAL